MVDSFITYDCNQGALSSPGFFSKNMDDMFRFTFGDADPETYGLIASQQTPPDFNQESFPKEVVFEIFSSHSGISTNPSMKHSPEYVASPDSQGRDDEQYARPNKDSSIMKKGIRKQYEPIVDNNIVYRYEEDASEYRKARKRIQNRESATRVRNRKKTHVEELEEEMEIIRKEKAELKVHNASLVAENNMLKQQITFLERIVSRNAPEDMLDNAAFPDTSRTETSDSMLHLMNKTEPSDSILQFMNKSDEDIENMQPSCKYFRAAPTHQFKKHVALLGVFTLLLCVYGLLPRTEPLAVQLFAKGTFGKANTIAFTVLGNRTQTLSDDGSQRYSIFDWWIELITLFSYILYMFYVGIRAYKRHALKKTNRILVPL